jgi:hypothetical protein
MLILSSAIFLTTLSPSLLHRGSAAVTLMALLFWAQSFLSGKPGRPNAEKFSKKMPTVLCRRRRSHFATTWFFFAAKCILMDI